MRARLGLCGGWCRRLAFESNRQARPGRELSTTDLCSGLCLPALASGNSIDSTASRLHHSDMDIEQRSRWTVEDTWPAPAVAVVVVVAPIGADYLHRKNRKARFEFVW